MIACDRDPAAVGFAHADRRAVLSVEDESAISQLARAEQVHGIIAPGINLSLDALVSAAAKLPRVAIEAPEGRSVIGRTTEEQMHIGIYWGYVAMMEGLIGRMQAEIGRPAKVVATGGLAALFDRHSELFDEIEGDLTIQGLAMLHRRSLEG